MFSKVRIMNYTISLNFIYILIQNFEKDFGENLDKIKPLNSNIKQL